MPVERKIQYTLLENAKTENGWGCVRKRSKFHERGNSCTLESSSFKSEVYWRLSVIRSTLLFRRQVDYVDTKFARDNLFLLD